MFEMKYARTGVDGRGRLEFGVLAASAALALGLAACGGGGIVGGEGDPIIDPGSIRRVLPQSAQLRVDLPGRVTTFVQVVDGNNEPVDTLTGEDFALYENGFPVSVTESGQRTRRDPQTFRSYSHLLIDRSNSVTQLPATRADIQEGARRYVRELFGVVNTAPPMMPPVYSAPDPELVATTFVRISWFDGSPTIHAIAGAVEGFSNDPVRLFDAIDRLYDEPPFNGSTNLYGAIFGGLDELDLVDAEASAQGIQNRTLTLVTFTDGTHQAGNAITLQQVIDELATIVDGRRKYNGFSIGLGTEVDPAVLQAIGPQGFASDTNDLLAAFTEAIEKVSKLANSFYVLAYCSPKTSGVNELDIGAGSNPTPTGNPFTFNANGFGAGCAFLDVRTHPVLAGLSPDFVFADAVEDAAGRVLAVGWRSDGCATPGCASVSQAVLVRFDEDGTIDEAFAPNNGGVVALEVPQVASGATSISLEPGGEAVIGGWRPHPTSGGATAAALWTVIEDPNNGGRALVAPIFVAPQGIGSEVIHDIVREDVATRPRLFAAGRVDVPAPHSAVWAFLPGQSFAVDMVQWQSTGVFVDPAPIAQAGRVARSIALQGNMGVIVAGDGPSSVPSSVNGGRDVQVMRLVPSTGALDPTFGAGGRVVATAMFTSQVGGPVFPGYADRVHVDGVDRIVVTGTLFATSGAGPLEQPAAWRLLPDGNPDSLNFRGSPSSVFPQSGLVTLRTGSTQNPEVDFGRPSQCNDSLLGPNGGVLLAGARSNRESHRDMALVAFRPTGVPDSYNVVGFLIEDGAAGDDADDVGQVVLRHSNGTVWTLGASRDPMATGDVPVVWLDAAPDGLFGVFIP